MQKTPSQPTHGVLLVSIAVLLFSTSPVLVRWAAPLPPLWITCGRLVVAGLVILTLAHMFHEKPLHAMRHHAGRFLLYGLVTALHFYFYIASLSFTVISHSLALVYTSPVFVAVLSALFLKEPLSARKWAGIAVAVLGVAVMAGFEPQLSERILIGDALAVLSAISFGFYSVFGRSQRDRFPLFTYAGSVYAGAALWLIPLVLLDGLVQSGSGTLFQPAWTVWLAVLALGLGPLAAGHTLYNAGLRRTSATLVNLIATQEVTGGVLLGALLLGEIPSPAALVGGLITLLGIILVIR